MNHKRKVSVVTCDGQLSAEERAYLDARTKGINAAMRRAAKAAANRARATGTKVYVMRNGKIVAETP
jgi:hypothetical protein